jgi:hypothetical protein
MDATPPTPAPLRERLPGYLIAFALGLAGGGLVGVIAWLATSMRLIDAVVYVYSSLGALLLLVGGIRGSGYGKSGRGSEEAVAGRGSRPEGSAGEGASTRAGWPERRHPLEGRRRRISAPPDPGPLWQVMAGLAYLGVGVALNLVFAPPPG